MNSIFLIKILIFNIFIFSVVGIEQCRIGYFLKDKIICEDCQDFCSRFESLTPEEKTICTPTCFKTTETKITTTTKLPVPSTVTKTELVSTTPVPNNISLSMLAVFVIPVVIVIIIIVLIVVFRATIWKKCKDRSSRTKRDNQRCPEDVPLQNIQEDFERTPDVEHSPDPLLNEDGDCVSPYLESIPYKSMDPKPIPRDLKSIKNPELVQSILSKANLNEAPSELIQTPKEKPKTHFDLSQNRTDYLSVSTDGTNNSVEESSNKDSAKSNVDLDDQEDDYRNGQLDSIYPNGQLDSIYPNGQLDSIYPTGQPDSIYTNGQFDSIYNGDYDDNNPRKRLPLERDMSCESTDACILPSIAPIGSNYDSIQIDQDNELDVRFKGLPVAPSGGHNVTESKLNELPLAPTCTQQGNTDPFTAIGAAPEDSPPRSRSLFSIEKKL